MGQQHAEGDFSSPGIVLTRRIIAKFRDDPGDGSIEFEKAALVQDHCHRSRGDDLGQRCQVEDGGGRRQGRIRGRRETAEGFQREKPISMGHRDGRGGKSAISNRLVEQGKSRGKTLILLLQSWDEGADLIHSFYAPAELQPEGL